MNLILLSDTDKCGEDKFLIDDFRFDHIINVLKAKAGDRLKAGFLNGPKGTVEIESVENNRIVLSKPSFEQSERPTPSIDVICALPRPQILKKVLFVCAMMAVENLYLIRTNRVEKSYFQSPLLEKDKMHKYLLEGLQQGENTFMPEVSIHNRFRPFFEDFLLTKDYQKCPKFFGHIESSEGLLSIPKFNSEKILLAVGPEGGWVDFEIDTLIASGFTPINLGNWNLRVEYAITSFLSQIELLKNR